MVTRSPRGGAALAAPLLLLCQSVVAAALDINPVRIDLEGPGRPAELRLTNTGSAPVSLQVDAREWSQDLNGADELVVTDALLAVPPLFTIAPGERQIVRIGYLGEPNADLEKSFRLIVTELASQAGTGPKAALSMRVQLSIPVFVAPTAEVIEPEIVLGEPYADPDGLRVPLRNAGNAHAKLKRIELRSASGWQALPSQFPGNTRYLLPHTQAVLTVPADLASFTAIRITSSDGRDWEHAVPAPQ